MLYKILFGLLIMFLPALLQAQDNSTPNDTTNLDDSEILYKHEMSGGIILHSNGFGINIRRGKHKTGFKKKMFELDIVTMKHPKEYKTVNPYFENSKGFILGKLNTFTVGRLGYGVQRVLVSRQDRRGGGVEIRYHYYGGLSLGFVKPVYLEILHATGVPFEFTLSTEKYDPKKHDINHIYGKAAFTKGLDEIVPYPGIYGKFGFSFEYASRQDGIKAIETGVVIDAYLKKVPIMAFAENDQFFVKLYLSVHIGSKWY